MSTVSRVVAVWLLGGAMACGSETTAGPSVSQPLAETEPTILTPTLTAVSPTTWTSGQVVKLVGAHFVDGHAGKVMVRLVGQMHGDSGGTQPVDMEVEATYRASNKAELVFEADTPPRGFGLTTGTFTGQVTATNVSTRGAEAHSAPITTTITVGPSIIVERLQPMSQFCSQMRTPSILNGEIIELDLAVTGMPAGSASAPIAIKAAYVDATDQAQLIETSITSGTQAPLTIDPGMLWQGDEPEGTNDARASRDVGISLTATPASGTPISRNIVVTIRQPYEVVYDGNSQVVERFEPAPVSGCLPGGQTGNNFRYHESVRESREREYELTGSFKVDVWILNLGFGFRVSEGVSSDSDSDLEISHGVFPHWYGVFYRQTSKLLRTGQIVRYDGCGVGSVVGDAYVTDWTWAPGFGQSAAACPPLPHPDLSDLGDVILDGS